MGFVFIIKTLGLGLRKGVVCYQRQWLGIWKTVVVSNPPELPPLKTFRPKHNLPVLHSYKVNAPDSFWGKFPSNYVQ